MRTTRRRPFIAAPVAAVLLLAACSDDGAAGGSPTGDQIAAVDLAAVAPGDGIAVTMARANWDSEYVIAELYRQIMSELGYEVSDPADLEIAPEEAYIAMAEGGIDFWPNGWFPGHLKWFESELSDGTSVGDHVVVVGEGVRAASGQGFLVTKSWAEEHDVVSMDQINRSPELIAELDAVDPIPGNGVWDVFGCQESWTCPAIIDSMFAFHGWENVRQVRTGGDGAFADYDAGFAEFLRLANEGLPSVTYTWFPSGYLQQAVPGDNVLWLTMHPDQVLDDSNPLGIDGGEVWDQGSGNSAYGASTCTQPCQLGWELADLHPAANEDFLAANPFLDALLPLVELKALDYQTLVVAHDAGGDVEQIVADWRAEHQDLIDQWVVEALAATIGA
jgi:glycine betaine/proline transport system substrate-binding protein